jgi:hypothetical protein
MGTQQNIAVELSAVIVGMEGRAPHFRIAHGPALPSGPLETGHRTLEQALRAWVRKLSALELGYVEQLYTFADKDRTDQGRRIVSIGYLALVGEHEAEKETACWYDFLPWEDHREGAPQPLMNNIQRALAAWEKEAETPAARRARKARIAVTFPKDPRAWNEELVLQRYELLWEASLIEESRNARKDLIAGRPMIHDHRRILATAIARLRAKIKYRPVVFELLPPRFTLLELQETVEALAGLRLHKQNFRRLILSQGLVEETDAIAADKKGRPAKLYAFRRTILQERAVAGTKLARAG